MKKYTFLSISIVVLILLVFFTYYRYKTKRIEHIIGANQYSIEEYLGHPNDKVTVDKIDINDVSKRIKEIIDNDNINTSQPILRYTLTGNIRKRIFWLIDQGDGYYVVEAIDTNK